MTDIYKDGESYKKIYAYRRRNGTYGCLEAIDYKDARRHLHWQTKIKMCVITWELFHECYTYDQYREAIFHGATTIDEVIQRVKEHGLTLVK